MSACVYPGMHYKESLAPARESSCLLTLNQDFVRLNVLVDHLIGDVVVLLKYFLYLLLNIN